jgi:hypothetical protein
MARYVVDGLFGTKDFSSQAQIPVSSIECYPGKAGQDN